MAACSPNFRLQISTSLRVQQLLGREFRFQGAHARPQSLNLCGQTRQTAVGPFEQTLVTRVGARG
eukprot:11187730-Lingulodinium_polyedra.AAC.2